MLLAMSFDNQDHDRGTYTGEWDEFNFESLCGGRDGGGLRKFV